MFGQTVTDLLRCAAPVHRARSGAARKKWVIFDGDANGGGIVPYNYRATDFYNAVQWAVGLELFLLIDDPWRVFFTTDHPNGAPFTDLSGDLRAADGPRPARAMDRDAAAGGDGDDRRLPSIDARIFAQRDRHHDARRAGQAARPDAIAAISAPAPSPTSPSTTDEADRAQDVPRGRARVQGRRTRRARRRGDALSLGPRAARSRPAIDRAIERRMQDYYSTIAMACRRTSFAVPATRDRPTGAVRGGAMRELIVKGVRIDDTFAEAFSMRATAVDHHRRQRAHGRARRRSP